MAEIQSQSQISETRLRSLFIPDKATVFLYFLLSSILLIVINLGSIISTLSSNYIGDSSVIGASFGGLLKSVNGSLSQALGGRLAQVIVWSFVGALVYVLVWFVRNSVNSFENDMIAAHYLHPKEFNETTYWTSTVSVKIFLLACSLITLSFLLLSLKVFLPALASLAGSSVYHFDKFYSPIYILLAVLAVMVDLYVTVTLFKLLGRLWKLTQYN